jgi:outer membrane lipoprotein-sorting protein
LVCTLLAAVWLAIPARAQTHEQKGLQIAEEAQRRDSGFGDFRAVLKMVLMNRQGETSERQLQMEGLENLDPNDGDKTMVVFDEPRDVKGVALMTFTHILQPDDQWLFLPALKRVKRISSSNKSGPFVGSEFAYEDLTSQEVKKFTYKWLRDEPCGDLTCFVVERYPAYENSGYTRQIVWIDQAEYRAQKVEYYDRKNELLKVLALTDYKKYLDKHWRAHNLQMVNQQTGKSTTLTWSNYEFKVGLTDEDFTQNRLKRMR